MASAVTASRSNDVRHANGYPCFPGTSVSVWSWTSHLAPRLTQTVDVSASPDILPERPTLVDILTRRLHAPTHGLAFAVAPHCVQSATLALRAGMDEEVVLACLLHDTGLGLARPDHGWWGAQLVEPYIPERTAWAIRERSSIPPGHCNGVDPCRRMPTSPGLFRMDTGPMRYLGVGSSIRAIRRDTISRKQPSLRVSARSCRIHTGRSK